ncbi:DNA-directed RNA polymerase subunit delta [Oceanobacillus limi]|uniref:Probable DNA-directed RNA polymerase subunit delta n=1 Tax=Oceanobacillus limi TaxID=930131 RepID=A0A1I0G718_9BACI|nr:DNA-directed RNA polymerase subunit delta [Oceanobacillus limi]SET66460.1 DNA-directed RNA polymerase subunit delta [Oceanobacillus limi]
MSLDNFGREELKNMSMIELAHLILLDEKKAINFREIFDKIAEMKEFTNEQKEEFIAQFYTDLNIDGRFMTLGSNMWGLKRWYPVEQMDEEVNLAPKKKKKKAKKKKKEVIEDDEIDIEAEDLDIVDGDVEELVDGFADDEDEDFDEIDDDFDDFDEDLDDDQEDDDTEDDEEEEK